MLEVRCVGKSYDGVAALVDVSMQFAPGEVTSVIGENGAGKSTLMKILSGVVQPDSGSVYMDDAELKLGSPMAAVNARISMVHQELNLIPTLSVYQNIFLGRESGFVPNPTKEIEDSERLLAELAAPFSARALCGNLSVAHQQLVEIAKALSQNAKYIIFDEPTAVLTEPECLQLFGVIRKLKQSGVGVIYISHRLPEVLELSDHIYVLRDGRYVGSPDVSIATERILADSMVGRELADIFPSGERKIGTERLTVKDFTPHGAIEPVSFSLCGGEIVGIGGLVGSGRTELAEAIAGLQTGSGTVLIDGKSSVRSSYSGSLKQRLAYLSEDRKGKGLVLDMSIEDNIALASLDRLTSPEKRHVAAAKWISDLGIRTSDSCNPASSLSGGNQQKVSLAKWLEIQPGVFLIDEPTRGVDVGAKAEIYGLIHQLAQQGMACLIISSEMPELIGLCDRVIVMRERKFAGTLNKEELSESKIMALAAGVGTAT